MRVKWKRLSALALAVMVSISCMSYPVHAKETKENEQLPEYDFATVEELKNSTNYLNVYFGDNNQKWLIVGHDRKSPHKESIVLFATTPLLYSQFHESSENMQYSEEWGCDYTSLGNPVPETVFANHWGGSTIRAKLKVLETTFFTKEEQKVMNYTKLYTRDSKNFCNYSTMDKLYLGYNTKRNATYMSVGTNGPTNENDHVELNNLRIPRHRLPKLKEYKKFIFLRGPFFDRDRLDVGAIHPDHYTYEDYIRAENAIVPAFELDLSNVAFASAAPAATATGELDFENAHTDKANGAFTLRYNSNNIGSINITDDDRAVNLKDVPEGTFLVVQNSNGAYAKRITNEKTVSAQEMNVSSFDNCRIWLETTDTANRITYATLEQSCTVNVTLSEGMELSSGSLTQKTDINHPIEDIVIRSKNGYMFPADYAVSEQNGITVTRDSENQITVSGTPTKDVNITLPPAIAKTYTIVVDKENVTFDSKNEGYENVASQDVIITNTGNSKVTLQTPTSLNYEIALSATELEPNKTATLTITPKENLIPGTYNEIITVNTVQNTSASTEVSFKVNGALSVSLDASATDIIEGQSVVLTANAQGGSGNYFYTWYADEVEDGNLKGNEVTVTPTKTTTYKVVVTDTIENKSATATITVTPKSYSLEAPTDYTFDSQHIGYKDVSANSFSIRNTGNVDVSNIHVALTGTNADAFTLDVTGMQNTLAPNGTTAFTVKPNADLGAGTYTTQVQITGETGITKTFEISFTVEDHKHKEEWKFNETSHWHECKSCGSKSEEGKHTFKWVIDKEATETEKGLKHEECTACGYKKASVEIPIVTPSNVDKPNTDKPNADKPNTDKAGNDKGSVETGDQTNVGLFTSLLVMSAFCIAILTVWKKKGVRNK